MRKAKIELVIIVYYFISIGIVLRLLMDPKRVYRHIRMEKRVKSRHKIT